jgi:hypothetical protein
MNTDLQPVLVIDPVVDVEESYKASEVVYKSGVNKSIYKYTADSYSDQNWIWNNITPPSLNTVVKRDLRVSYSFLVLNTWTVAGNEPTVFNAVNGAGVPTYAGNNNYIGCVPRSAPVQSSASSIELRLNGSATSVSINDYACIYPHLMNLDEIAKISSEMPLEKDNSAVYNPANGVGPQNAFNDNRSPLAPYNSNPATATRGSFTCTQLYYNAGGATGYAVYQFDLTEQLFISPMVWSELMDKSAGLSNINNLILNIRFADLNRLVSASLGATNALQLTFQKSIAVAGAPGGSVSGANFQTPTLLIEYITQDPILAAKQPQTLVYDYSLIQPFISLVSDFDSGTVDVPNFTAQSLRLASIPSKLYIFARPSKSALNTATLAQTIPDNFLRIKNLSINFNNRVNLLATYTESDLWSMSVKNGLQDSFNEWKYHTGSVCIVDIVRDLGLESDETDGQSNKYSTLQITATLSASPLAWAGQGTTLKYDFYILVEQPGKAFINASECQYILTGPSASEVLKLTSEMEPRVDHTEIEGKGVGGSVFGKVGKLLKSGVNMFKGINPEHVAKGVEMAQGALKSLGLGVAGGAMKKHSRVY